MTNGNKRYLGDVWINQENLNRQRQFFQDIINSYQYKNGGSFDASTLQGFSASAFATAEQGLLANNSIQAPLILGKTNIENTDASQYIYSDATLLYDQTKTYDPTSTDYTEQLEQRLKQIEWFSDLTRSNIGEALIAIFNAVNDVEDTLNDAIENLDETKLDTTTYQTFYDNDYTPFKDIFSDVLTTFTDSNGETVTQLNASLVNGIRFILITQEEYDQLPAETKQYWRNVFIIKEHGLIPPEYSDPLSLDLSDGYSFRVSNNYLQVNNGLTDEWKNICTLADLLSGSNLDNVVGDYLLQNDNFNINVTSLAQSIQSITPSSVENDQSNYPFLSSNYIDDFVKNITLNGSSADVTETINNSTHLKTVDLNINNVINSSLTPVNNQINTISSSLNTEKGKISTAQQDILSLQTQMNTANTKNTQQDSSINSITNQLNQINNSLSAINSNISSLTSNLNKYKSAISNWQTYNIGNLKDDSRQSKIRYNTTLKIAYIYLRFKHYHDKDDHSWCYPRKSYSSKNGYIYYNAGIPEELAPLANLTMISNASPAYRYLEVSTNGYVNVASTENTTGLKLFYGTGVYRIR